MQRGRFAAKMGVWILSSALVFVGQSAYGDSLPTHGAGPHLDPFVFGPVAGGLVGPPANGTAGEIVPAGAASVPWSQAFTAPAIDGLSDLAAPWHWTAELDFLGLNGIVPTSVNGSPFFPVTYGAGTDLLIDINQPDLGGSGSTGVPGISFGGLATWGSCDILGSNELGTVCKQLVNLTSGDIAWGVSVTESPGALGTTIIPAHGDPPWSAPVDFHNTMLVEILQNGDISIRSVPEPTTALLVTIGLVGFGLSQLSLNQSRRSKQS